jgi:hypothetical protein
MKYTVISAVAIMFFGSTSGQSVSGDHGPVERIERTAPSEIERTARELVSTGEYEGARALMRQMYRNAPPRPNSRGPVGTPEPRMGLPGEGDVQDPRSRWGNDILVHSGGVRAHDCDYTADGEMWTAVSLDPESTVYVYSSDDGGESWTLEFWADYDEPIFELEILSATGDSNFVFLFAIIPYVDGRLHLVRYDPEGLTFESTWVDDGDLPVSDFSACKDYYDDYFLYVLYTDESGPSVLGKFKRSRDFGLNWNADPADTTSWWNAWDPHISCGGGAWLHTICKLSDDADVLYYYRNEFFGHRDNWWGVEYPNHDTFQVWDPCIIATPSVPDNEAAVWTLYTHAWQGTNDLDVDYAYSLDGGTTWTTGNHLAWTTRVEFGPDCAHYFPTQDMYASACYHDATSSYDTIDVYTTHVDGVDPDAWSPPSKVNEENACVMATAQVVYVPGHPPEEGPAVLFTRYGPTDLYFDAPWIEDIEEGSSEPISNWNFSCTPAIFRERTVASFELPSPGEVDISVYDASGRRVVTLSRGTRDRGTHSVWWRGEDGNGRPVPAGTYFVRISTERRNQVARATLIR